jgi:enoyl-CoA hydratase
MLPLPPLLRIDRHASVAEVVLDNPARLNAFDPEFFRELRAAFQKLRDDESVAVILIWAEGRIFSPGLNLNEAMGLIPELSACASEAARNRRLYEIIREYQASISEVRRSPKPVLAAIHGMCLGGGLDLATACDIRLCSADALFSIQETKLAMVADLGTLQRIGRICGRGFVREMAFSGAMIPAERALSMGLVNQVHPDKAALLEAARAMAREIARNSTFVVQGIKQVLEYSETHSEEDGLDYVAHWNTSFFLSRDLGEALRSFAEKREPRFTGE